MPFIAANISEISCVEHVTILKNKKHVHYYLLPQKKQLINLLLKYCGSHKSRCSAMYFQSIIRTNCIIKYSIWEISHSDSMALSIQLTGVCSKCKEPKILKVSNIYFQSYFKQVPISHLTIKNWLSIGFNRYQREIGKYVILILHRRWMHQKIHSGT